MGIKLKYSPALQIEAIKTIAILVAMVFTAAADLSTPIYIPFAGYYIILIFLSIWYFKRKILFFLIFITSIITVSYVSFKGIPHHAVLWEYLLTSISIVVSFSFFSILTIKLKYFFEKIKIESETDELTGLKNNRSFFVAGRLELSRGSRLQVPITIAMLDLDNLKRLNDSIGHASGDDALAAVGQLLKTSLRETDIAARIGGDEFAIILPNTNIDGASSILSRLHKNIKTTLETYGDYLSCSIGAAILLPTRSDDIHAVLEKADALMYAAKSSGKNCLRIENIIPISLVSPNENKKIFSPVIVRDRSNDF